MRILNIDDSTVNNMLMENIISSFGYQAHSILEGSGIVEKIEEYRPNVIILDLMMPDKSGFDILAELNARGINIPVIVVTAMNSSELKRRALELGAVDYQAKPVNMKSLKKSLDKAFQGEA